MENFSIGPKNEISLNLFEKSRALPCGRVGRRSLITACHTFYQKTSKKLKTVTGRAGGKTQSDDKSLGVVECADILLMTIKVNVEPQKVQWLFYVPSRVSHASLRSNNTDNQPDATITIY